VTETTWQRWKNIDGARKATDAIRLKELEMENRRLKGIVADRTLDILTGKKLLRGDFSRQTATPVTLRQSLDHAAEISGPLHVNLYETVCTIPGGSITPSPGGKTHRAGG
jgi:hypothetical protein